MSKRLKKISSINSGTRLAIILFGSFFLLRVTTGQSPVNIPDYLSEKFTSFCRNVPREEIFVHTDREYYVAGEEIWFSTYLIDRQTLRPSSKSRIVYFELLNSENRPVVQKKIFMKDGMGQGHIVLPDTLSNGIYTIRAYTNWMKNFMPDNCFIKYITLCNILNTNLIREKITERKSSGRRPAAIAGVKLKVDNSNSGFIDIELATSEEFRSENKNVYLFIQTRGNINHIGTENLDGNLTTLRIPRSELGEGVNQITLFNSIGKPVADRYIYSALMTSNILRVTCADSIALREHISVKIETAIKGSSDNLSISVAPLIKDQSMGDIKDYLVFGSEFGLTMLNRNLNNLSGAAIDSLLSGTSSNWIDWSQILSGKVPSFKYQPEIEDHFIYGKFLNGEDQPVNSSILLCTPGKEAGFQYSLTDPEGNFTLRIPIDDKTKDLVIIPDAVAPGNKLIMESSFADKYFSSQISHDSVGHFPQYFNKLSVNHQVQKIYGNSSDGKSVKFIWKNLKPTRFYGRPDIELVLVNYISLPVMSEIFFELLPGVSMKMKKSGAEISITYRIDDDQFTTSPCLMIDGVIIRDASLIANLDPQLVEKIDVIKEQYIVGKYEFNGIVNIITKAGDFSCIPLPGYMIRFPYKVIEPVITFSSPDYSSEELRSGRIPDYRNTLYWNAAVKTDNSGKAEVEFWSADNSGYYVINIEGITDDGKVISDHKILRVK